MSDDETATNIWSPPEEIVTVAVDPDPTLRPIFRDRYFACVMDEEDNPVVQYEPEFAFPGPFAAAAEQEATLSRFMTGPIRWLFVRLQRFPRVLLWPYGGFGRSGLGLLGTTEDGESGAWLPCLRQWLREATPKPLFVGAVVLDLGEPQGGRVLCEVANFVGENFYDFYVSDLDGSEVYLLHHHEKVVVSIPDQHTRWLLLEDLAAWSNLFEDWSGYASPMDEEEQDEIDDQGETMP
jgi:hypothetical protein